MRNGGVSMLETSVLKASISDNPKKSPIIAAVTSFFVPGLGQIYNGDLIKGLAFIIIGIILVLLAFVFVIPAMMAPALLEFVLILSIPYLVFWAYNIYDAYTTADKINSRTDLK
jgi:TM2 domain-containing membrane protein YozV